MSFEPENSSYTTCSMLGNCFFDKGTVYLSKHNKSGSLVAVKHFSLEQTTQDEYQLIEHEVILMRQLKHPNIISCLTSYVMNFDLYVLSPLMGFGSCHNLISAHFQDGLPEIVICFFLRDVLQALDYLHTKGYIHRAVRARHILVHADGHTCLSGLRYMCPISKDSFHNKVHMFPLSAAHNLNWLSPELLEQNCEGYDEKSDIYSIGITACELANGIVPFAETSTTLMLTEKVRGMAPQLLDCTTWFMYEDNQNSEEPNYSNAADGNQTKTITRRFTEPFHTFVELCSHRNVTIRPTSKQLLNHNFFKQLRRVSVNIPELLKPAVPFTEINTTGLPEDLATVQDLQDLSYQFKEINMYPNEWDF